MDCEGFFMVRTGAGRVIALVRGLEGLLCRASVTYKWVGNWFYRAGGCGV